MPVITVPTEHTVTFVQAEMAAGSRILEVGCGNGELAAELSLSGYQVVAIDRSAEAVSSARSRGVDARLVHWPDFTDEPFDAILFTRSLHHIDPLNDAIASTAKLLRPHGKVVVEDFAFSEIDVPSMEWLFQILTLLNQMGMIDPDGHPFARQVLNSGDEDFGWRHEHDYNFHKATAMLEVIRRHFKRVSSSTTTYLFRYVAAALIDGKASEQIAKQILLLEQRMADRLAMRLIGRRFVAVHDS